MELAESDRPRVLSEFLRSVLLTTGIAGFERTPVSVRIANALLYEGCVSPSSQAPILKRFTLGWRVQLSSPSI